MSMSGPTALNPAPSTMKKRGSWSVMAELAADMVNGLDFGNGDEDIMYKDTPSHRRPVDIKQNSLPAMNSRLSSPVPTTGATQRVTQRASWSVFSSEDDDDYDYDPRTMDLKAQAKQQSSSSRSTFSSFTAPARKRAVQTKKDPLMASLEQRGMAEHEYRKQQLASKRRQQCRDHDDDKSLASMGSFFEFLTSGAADELLANKDDDQASNDGLSVSAHSMASNFMGLFGDDADEIAKLSSPTPATVNKEEKEFRKAVDRSKSVKGDRVYSRGARAAKAGDWKKAVAYYHIALVKQRKHYGEDHLVTAKTLNSLGLALTHMGEHFGALTALEEALQIRQDLLGAGAEEVAETTSNIWMVLKASQDAES